MRANLTLALFVLCGLTLTAQNVISSRSGMIHYVDGYGTTVDGLLLAPKNGEFPLMKDGDVLATEHSRVEVLLNPGIFLRLAEHSSIKMLATRLSDSQVEFLSGTGILEVDEIAKGNNLTVQFHDWKITPLKHGLFRLDAGQNRFRVFEGEAQVVQGEQTAIVKAGHQVEFGAVLATGKFNRKKMDLLDEWALQRALEIERANVMSANAMRRGGSSSGVGFTNSSWVWNSYFGLFTFLPYSGYGYSPYGWRFYSPGTVVNYYRDLQTYQQPGYNSGNSIYSASNGAADMRSSVAAPAGSAISNPAVSPAPAGTSGAMTSMSRGSVSGGGASSGR